MKQYCRYCIHANDYNGEGVDFICDAEAPCGNNGSGKFYAADKAKRANQCKHFGFNENDVFGYNPDGSFKTYKPQEERQPKIKPEDVGQIKFRM